MMARECWPPYLHSTEKKYRGEIAELQREEGSTLRFPPFCLGRRESADGGQEGRVCGFGGW